MKWIVYIIVGLLILIGLMLAWQSFNSRKQPDLGLNAGKLLPCPATPNCVCSEYPSEQAYIEPLTYSVAKEVAWQKLKQVVDNTGGKISTENEDYLRVVYETPLMRFSDDVEFRHDLVNMQIHVRSASRVGRSDLGTNRERVEKIRTEFKE